jgi:hypothetical protein
MAEAGGQDANGQGRTSQGSRGIPNERTEWNDRTSPIGAPPIDAVLTESPVPPSGNQARDHAAESTPAVADKALHDRLSGLTDDELARLPVIDPGAQLEQGGIYFDLNHPENGSFKAIGGHEATAANRYIAKRDTDYLLWNRIVGQDEEPSIERPEGSD